MRKLVLRLSLILAFALASFSVQAQSTFTMPPPAGVSVLGVQVVSSCGMASLSAGQTAFVVMDITGTVCTGSSAVSAAIGSPSDSVCPSATGTCSLIALTKFLNTAAGNPIPAGNSANGGAAGNIGAVAQYGSPWGVNINYGGTPAVADPCQTNAAVYTPINVSSSGTTRILIGTASKKVYFCSFHVVTASGDNVALVEGATSCSSPTGIAGGNTAATGWNITGNGISLGNGGYSVMAEATAGDDVCLITSVGQQVSGAMKTVVQ